MNPVLAAPLFGPALPEIILAIGVLVLILFGALRGERTAGPMNIIALALLVVAMIAVLILPSEHTETMNGSFVVDSFAKFMKSLILLGSIGGIILSLDFFRREGIN